jgi:hypothetical protein
LRARHPGAREPVDVAEAWAPGLRTIWCGTCAACGCETVVFFDGTRAMRPSYVVPLGEGTAMVPIDGGQFEDLTDIAAALGRLQEALRRFTTARGAASPPGIGVHGVAPGLALRGVPRLRRSPPPGQVADGPAALSARLGWATPGVVSSGQRGLSQARSLG